MLVLGSAAATDSVAAVVEVDVQHWHNQHNIPEWSFPVQNNQIYPGTAEIWIQHLYSYKYWVNKTGYMVDKCPNCDSSHTTSQLFNFQSDQPHSQGSMGKTCKNCQISKSGNICWWSQLEEPKLQNERCFHLKNKIIKKKKKIIEKTGSQNKFKWIRFILDDAICIWTIKHIHYLHITTECIVIFQWLSVMIRTQLCTMVQQSSLNKSTLE